MLWKGTKQTLITTARQILENKEYNTAGFVLQLPKVSQKSASLAGVTRDVQYGVL